MSNPTTYTGFVSLYNDHKHKIYNYFYYRTFQDPDLAEDLTSDTFVKAFEKIDSYDDSYAFSTWIYRIARNTLIDHIRASKTSSLDEFQQEFVDEESTEFIDLIDDKIDIERIRETFTELPSAQKSAIEKRYFQYMSVKEIATEEGSNDAAVRKNLSRGMGKIKELLILVVILLLP